MKRTPTADDFEVEVRHGEVPAFKHVMSWPQGSGRPAVLVGLDFTGRLWRYCPKRDDVPAVWVKLTSRAKDATTKPQEFARTKRIRPVDDD